MKKTFILIILSVLYFSATAQDRNLTTDKIFHIDLKIKEVDINPFSECKFIEKTPPTKNCSSSNSTFMKLETMPSQRQIRIDYIHKPYEPTLIEGVGSLIYNILEDKFYPHNSY